MTVLGYFNLQIEPDEPQLGRRRKSAKILRNTIVMYIGVFLGVLGRYIFANYLTGKRLDIGQLDPFWIIISLIVAAVVFPQVYKGTKFKIEAIDPLQFFIAFQNGFFWQSILEVIAKGLVP
jgi:hypothetical protein